jgi:hypothetical protein
MKIPRILNIPILVVRFCEEKLLPLIIALIEPKDDPVIRSPLFTGKQRKKSSNLEKPNTFVTLTEAQTILDKYKTSIFMVWYGGIAFAIICIYAFSLLSKTLNPIIETTKWIVLTANLAVSIIAIVLCIGVSVSIKTRMKIWERARDDEIEISKLEYFAKNKSSKVMAQILFEIEKLKDERREEAEMLKKVTTKRSILDMETMRMFNAMMDEREKEITRKGNIKATMLWLMGIIMGYGIEKSLDFWLFGTTSVFRSNNQ